MPNFSIIIGIQKGPGQKVKLMLKLIFHPSKGGSKCIFPTDNMHVSKMIDFLLVTHPLYDLITDPTVTPFQIPDFRLCEILDPPIKSFRTTDFQ